MNTHRMKRKMNKKKDKQIKNGIKKNDGEKRNTKKIKMSTKYFKLKLVSFVTQIVQYNKENLEWQETNKNGRGTERHLPKTDESVVRPAGEHR